MRSSITILSIVALAVSLVAGCSPGQGASEVVSEGTILSVEYQREGGGTAGFTRINHHAAVPGGNGSWNVDAHGRLTRDFLFITRPQHKELGEQVIPTKRLVSIQFGDGGIKQVDENKPEPAK